MTGRFKKESEIDFNKYTWRFHMYYTFGVELYGRKKRLKLKSTSYVNGSIALIGEDGFYVKDGNSYHLEMFKDMKP